MKYYWSIHAIPELAQLPKDQRLKVWRTVVANKLFVSWQFWMTYVLPIGILIGLVSLVGYSLRDPVRIWLLTTGMDRLLAQRLLFIGHILMVGIGAGASILLVSLVAVHQIRPYLREYINTRKME